MPSGGARTRSGPPPDPDALRRDRKTDGDWIVLPAEGRRGAAPRWPLTVADDDALAEREAAVWRRLWATPQAVQWQRMRQEMEVALYARRLVEAEKPGSATSTGTLVRQMADALGLTIPGMRTNRWKIATDQLAAKREERQGKAAAATPRATARDRFRGDAAG